MKEAITHIWKFDHNRRVYERDAMTGKAIGSPIWRKHWVKYKVEGETSRSWIIECGRTKVSKKKPNEDYNLTYAFSEEQIDMLAEVRRLDRALIAQLNTLCREVKQWEDVTVTLEKMKRIEAILGE